MDNVHHAEHDAIRDAQEAEWLSLLAAGGPKGDEAWALLFKAYRPRILRRYRRCRLSLAAAEDLMQDVMVTLHDKASQFRAERPAGPWIMGIAINKLRDWLERHEQKLRQMVDDEVPEVEAIDSARVQVVSQDVIDDCRRRRWREFASARPRAALALQLCHAEGWTMAELADFLGMTEGSAKGFVHLERPKAKAALAPCEPGDDS